MGVHLEELPDELLVHIIKFLPHEDLVAAACVSNRLCDIVCDVDVVRRLDLRRIYHLTTEDLKVFFLPRLRCRSVQHLSLDHVYWVRVPGLVVKLKNLASLAMQGIPLTFLQLKWILTSCTKLQQLHISWPDDMELENRKQWMGGFDEAAATLGRLTALEVLLHANPMSLPELLAHCGGLRRLVMRNHHVRISLPAPSCQVHCRKLKFPHLKELVVDQEEGAFPAYVFGHLVHSIIDGCEDDVAFKTCWLNYTAYRELVGSAVLNKCSTVFLEVTPNSQGVLQELGVSGGMTALLVGGQTFTPVSLASVINSCPDLKCLCLLSGVNVTMDTKLVGRKLPGLERFSVCCQPEKGPPKIVDGIALLHNLTHLSVPTCALIEKMPREESQAAPVSASLSGGLKRKRVAHGTGPAEPDTAAFNLVFQNCPNIKLLEIISSKNVSCSPRLPQWECLANITKLRHLTHLTLEDLPITNANFLIDVCRECERLEFLRLRNLGPSGKCVYLGQLPTALAHCHNLVRLRLEQNYLAPGTTLLKGLRACRRLQKLFISAEKDMSHFDLASLAELIDTHSRLNFVFVVAGSTPKGNCTKFTRKYKKPERPALVVRVRTTLYDVFDDKNTENRTTPACHYNEMVSFRSWFFEPFV